MSGGVLYISYDGMLEPLGQSQVLAYLQRLAADRPIDLISFEKESDWSRLDARAEIEARCVSAGIRWHPMRYHKRPSALATAYDIAVGSIAATCLARRVRPSVIHARSYVPGLMALAAKRASGAKFLFDMRGFWADERIDGNIWPRSSRLYRMAKSAERLLLRSADHIVTLTEASLDELPKLAGERRLSAPVSVIPTCADLNRFALQPTPPREPLVIGHIGAVGTWYLLDEMVRAFAAIHRRRTDARWLIVNRGEHDLIQSALQRQGVAPKLVELRSADPSEMPALIARMHAGMAIIRPAFSKIASAPTKLAEYLGCGRPCLGNHGVGDMPAILEGRRVGAVIHDFDEVGLDAAALDLLDLIEEPGIGQRCRTTAEELFSLDQGVEDYAAIYRSLGA